MSNFTVLVGHILYISIHKYKFTKNSKIAEAVQNELFVNFAMVGFSKVESKNSFRK